MARTFKGDVSFMLHDNQPSPHRFEVSVTDENTIILWLEDRQSKKQWQTDALGTTDFLNEGNAIPKAMIGDYAERFGACLADTDDGIQYERAISTKGSDRVLALSIPLQWASFDLAVEYKFTMKEVPLARIDILSARMRDVEEKLPGVDQDRLGMVEVENTGLKRDIQRLAERIDAHRNLSDRLPVFAQATTTVQHSANQKLVWTAGQCEAGGVIEFLPRGPIRFRSAGAGVYAIDVGVVHVSAENSVIFELRRADTTLATCHGSSYRGFTSTTTLRYILKADANDEVYVLYKATGYAQSGSYITIVKL